MRTQTFVLLAVLGAVSLFAIGAFGYQFARSALGASSGAQQRAEREPMPPRYPEVAIVEPVPLPAELPIIAIADGDTVDTLAIRALVVAEKTELLERFFEEAQQRFEADPRLELWPLDVMAAFEVPDEQTGKCIETWIARGSRSFAPYLARAAYHLSRAWYFRGGAFVRETRDERLEAMRQEVEAGLADLAEARRRHPSLVIADTLEIDFAKLRGDDGRATRAYVRATRSCPSCLFPRLTRLVQLQPRWGGSVQAQEEVIEEALAHLARNPRLGRLRGELEHDRCWTAYAEHHLLEALPHCEAAAAAGGGVGQLTTLAEIEVAIGELDSARRHAERAIALRPSSGPAHEALWKVARALDDVDLLEREAMIRLRLDPSDHVPYLSEHTSNRLANRAVAERIFGDAEAATRHEAAARRVSAATADRLLDFYANRLRPEKRQELERLSAELRAHPDDLAPMIALDAFFVSIRGMGVLSELWTLYLARHPGDARALRERSGTRLRDRSMIDLSYADAEAACRLGDRESCDVLPRIASMLPRPPERRRAP